MNQLDLWNSIDSVCEIDRLDLWNSIDLICEIDWLDLWNSINSIYGTRLTWFMEFNRLDLDWLDLWNSIDSICEIDRLDLWNSINWVCPHGEGVRRKVSVRAKWGKFYVDHSYLSFFCACASYTYWYTTCMTIIHRCCVEWLGLLLGSFGKV